MTDKSASFKLIYFLVFTSIVAFKKLTFPIRFGAFEL